MASIGSETFDFVSLPGDPPGETLEVVTRPGVDGIALQKVGKRGDSYRLVAMSGEVDKDAAKAKINACMDLKGTIVDVVDDHGTTWEDIAIMDVRIRRNKGVARAVGWGANVTKILTVEFYCRDTRTAP